MAGDEKTILLIEDNDDDVKLITRAFKKTKLPSRLEVARDGVQALAYLFGEPPYDDRGRYPAPALVILDLRMPGVDGYDVLARMKEREELRDVPTVVLSAVREAASVGRTYELGAAVYFVKPSGVGAFDRVAREIENYWLAHVAGPEADDSA